MRWRHPCDSSLAIKLVSNHRLHLLRTVLVHMNEFIRHPARTTRVNCLDCELEWLLQVGFSHCSIKLVGVGDSSSQESVGALVRNSLIPKEFIFLDNRAAHLIAGQGVPADSHLVGLGSSSSRGEESLGECRGLHHLRNCQ